MAVKRLVKPSTAVIGKTFDGKLAAKTPAESAKVLTRFVKAAKITLLGIEDAVETGKLKLWKENPRTNDGYAVPRLAELLREKGQVSPIVAWKKTGVIYKGNTTFKAMVLLGMKTVRVQWVDFPSEAAAIAYGISDNKSSEWAEWDDGILSKLLSAGDVSTGSGFSETETDILFKLGTSAGSVDANAEWDDMPEFTLKAKSFKSVVVHFSCQQDVDAFANCVEQEIKNTTRYIWFPKKEFEQLKGTKGFMS